MRWVRKQRHDVAVVSEFALDLMIWHMVGSEIERLERAMACAQVIVIDEVVVLGQPIVDVNQNEEEKRTKLIPCFTRADRVNCLHSLNKSH